MVSFHWPRLRRLGGRILGGRPVPLVECAKKRWVIAPPENTSIPPAIFDASHLERIRSLSPWRNQMAEDLLIHGGSLQHAASIAYIVEDATLAGSHIYCGPSKHPCSPRHENWFSPGRQYGLDHAHLAATFASTHSFANFVLDELSLQLLIPEEELQIGASGTNFRHAAGYRSLLGLPGIHRYPFAHIKQLTVYEDFSQHRSKRDRYHELRRRLRAASKSAPGTPTRGVFLDRGETGERRILSNSAAIRDTLAARGFTILHPERMNTEAIMQAMLDAPIVVGVEGSQLSHAAYTLADHGSFLVLQPPDRFAMTYKEFTDCMSMQFAFLVGIPKQDGFEIPLDELCRMIDRLAVK